MWVCICCVMQIKDVHFPDCGRCHLQQLWDQTLRLSGKQVFLQIHFDVCKVSPYFIDIFYTNFKFSHIGCPIISKGPKFTWQLDRCPCSSKLPGTHFRISPFSEWAFHWLLNNATPHSWTSMNSSEAPGDTNQNSAFCLTIPPTRATCTELPTLNIQKFQLCL